MTRTAAVRIFGAIVFALVAAAGLSDAAVAAEAVGAEAKPASHSGYERVRPLGGPDSVNSSLRRHDAKKDTFYRGHAIRDALSPYYAVKRRLKERYGLAFGLDFNMLYQGATAGLTDDQAAGGVFRFYGHWTLLGRGTPTTGEFVFRIENRHTLGTDLSPSELGPALGSLFKTANSFDSWGWGLTNLQWQQWFANGRYGIAVGQLDLRDWVDPFDLSNWRTGLLSSALTYPTNPLPAAGLGGAAFAYFREENTPYALVGIGDANGKPHDPSWDSFFEVGEYYTYAQVGWTPAFARKNQDNLRLTYWHQDALTAKGTRESWGLSISAGWRFEDRYAPFVRMGYSEGTAVPCEAALVAGLGIHRKSHDLFGVALGWGRPHESGLRDQFTLETFYRLQISQNVGITPDLQLHFDPSRNPDESVIAVFGLRMQFAF